jgi:hypothetical protein
MVRIAVVVGVLGLAATASAQSVNVNFGPADGAPASSYGAAGAVGTWNSVSGIAGQTFEIVDLSGAPTAITMSQSPTTTMLTGADPSVSGDDAKLLDTGLDTTGAETCLAFNGFTAGDYEVLVYAWTPNAPSVLSRTRQDEAPSTIDVGGAWTGAHVEGVTYARYVVTVGADGNLPAHSGLATDQPSPRSTASRFARWHPRSMPARIPMRRVAAAVRRAMPARRRAIAAAGVRRAATGSVRVRSCSRSRRSRVAGVVTARSHSA